MRLNTLEKLKCDYKIEKYLKYVKAMSIKEAIHKKSREVRKKSKR